jgi:hypothetical protein
MPDIQAFHALRYDLGHVGALSDVVAPPYDVISPELQDQLYERHPANVIRLILNREEPGDDETHHRYQRAAHFFKTWRSDGVLQLDPDPALYVYHQSFHHAGREFQRRGFMTRVRLERFGEGDIYPHEETHSAAKADRLRLTMACRANLSQVFGLYPDERNEAQELLEQAIIGQTPLEATDHLGVVHRMWTVTDVKVISEVAALMGPRPMYIADGHHRYETACNYRDQLAASGTLSPEHPANFVLTMCVSMSDPGMVVLPTHRLFRGLPPLSSQQLIDKLEPVSDPGCRRRTGCGDRDLGCDRRRRRTGNHRPVRTGRRALGAGQHHAPGSGANGGTGTRAQPAVAGLGRQHPAPVDHREPAGGPRSAQVRVRPLGRRGARTAPAGRSAGRSLRTRRAGHARHAGPHPDDQRARGTDASQEHLLLPETAQRFGIQPAGIGESAVFHVKRSWGI